VKTVFISSVSEPDHPRRVLSEKGPLRVVIPAHDPYADLVEALCRQRGWECRRIERHVVGDVELPLGSPFVFVVSLRPICRGTTATVYEASTEDAVIILKQIPLDAGMDHPVKYLLASQEAKLWVDLRSPWTVPVLGTGTTPSAIWIAMERMDATLDRALETLDAAALSLVLADACRGLAFLHEAGWVHMDVKPQNIFVHQGRGRLGDFSAMWRRGVCLPISLRALTPRYADPRLLRPEGRILEAVPEFDVYSMGVVLRELVEKGRLPPTVGDLARRCLGSQRPSAGELAEGLEEFSRAGCPA
jgi:serine/threonine protein kinase